MNTTLKLFETLKVNCCTCSGRFYSVSGQPSFVWNSTRRSYKTSNILPKQLEGFPPDISKKPTFLPFLANFKRLFKFPKEDMGYFVIGVSGITCGGKTSLTKLIQKTFPWAHVIHQDHYFYDDDWPHHIRCPEAENHVNYEIFHSLDMNRMFEDVRKMIESPATLYSPKKDTSGQFNGMGDKAETPNYDDEFLKQIPNHDFNVTKYSQVPILILEGFTIFASQFLFDQCDVRFFCSLDKETCRNRRNLRSYFPPDTPSYFEKIVWPEYEKHFNDYIDKRSGVTVFDGCTAIDEIWKNSVQIVTCRMEEKGNTQNVQYKSSDMLI